MVFRMHTQKPDLLLWCELLNKYVEMENGNIKMYVWNDTQTAGQMGRWAANIRWHTDGWTDSWEGEGLM